MKTKTSILSFIFSLLMLTLHAQTDREARSLRDFNAVKVSNAIKVELVKGDENKAEIVVSGIELEKVETTVVDQTLEIKLARGNFRNHRVDVVITYKDIQGIEAATSASVIAKDLIEASEAYLFGTTSAYIEANVQAEILNIEAATNARIYVKGNVDGLGIRAFTNAEIDGKGLLSNQVDVLANTAATVYCNTSGLLEGSAATAGKVYYNGSPKEINVKTGTGGLIARN
jgi:hypothetical protein